MSLLHAGEGRQPPAPSNCGGRFVSEEAKREDTPSERPRPGPPRLLTTADLFRGEKEIWIEHAGVRYRLRITRRNRLILQK